MTYWGSAAGDSGLRRPVHSHEISISLKICLDLAVEGALHRFANAARQVDVRRVDHQALRILLDADDPIERMLRLLRLLLMVRQADHLLFVLPGEITPQRHDAGRKFVVDPTTRSTELLVSGLRPRHPLPAPVVIDGAALRADRALKQLLLSLVRVEDMILLGVPGNPTTGSRPAG